MKYTPIISSGVRPTDVKIYIEDGVPYLDYIGTFMLQMVANVKSISLRSD